MVIKPRIIFNAKDAPTLASGYAIIGKHLLPRLAKHYGKDAIVLFAPVHFRDGMIKEWEGIKVVSGYRGDYHDDMMLEVYRREGATMLLMVGDWFHLRTLPEHARDNPDFLWCLAGETLITTPDGSIRLDQCRPGMQVLGYDGAKPAWATVQATQKIPWAKQLLRIELEDGRHIDATRDHLMFTQRGWARCDTLNSDDVLLEVNQHAPQLDCVDPAGRSKARRAVHNGPIRAGGRIASGQAYQGRGGENKYPPSARIAGLSETATHQTSPMDGGRGPRLAGVFSQPTEASGNADNTRTWMVRNNCTGGAAQSRASGNYRANNLSHASVEQRGSGIFGGDRGRGRNDHPECSEMENIRSHDYTHVDNFKHSKLLDGLAQSKVALAVYGTPAREIEPVSRVQNDLGKFCQRQHDSCLEAISDHQEETGRLGTFLHRFEASEEIQSPLRQAGSNVLSTGEAAQCTPRRIRRVTTTPGTAPFVYDITTSTGNFFANDFLSHNCQWAPFDFLRVPPEVTQLLKYAMYVVPFGDDAERRARAAGLGNVLPGIPLGVEPAIWRPLKPEDYRLASQSCGFEEGAVNFLIVSANQQRKYVREQLEGIALWRRGTPGARVRLYLHGHVEGDRNFQDDLRDAGLDDVTAMPNPYDLMQGGFSEETMNRIFNSASIVMNACLPTGQHILTDLGAEPIEQIKPGRMVMTHLGRLSPVRRVFERAVDDKIVVLKPSHLPPVRMTPEHPVLILRPSEGVECTSAEAASFWNDLRDQGTSRSFAASLLNVSPVTLWNWSTGRHTPDPLNRSSYRIPIQQARWINAAEVEPGDITVVPYQADEEDVVSRPLPNVKRQHIALPENVVVDEEFLWVAGMFLAEGTPGPNKAQLRLSLGTQDAERGHVERLRRFFAERLGLESVVRTGDRHRVNFAVYSRPIAEFFASEFGSTAKHKHFPIWASRLPRAKLSALIEGLIDGDGHRSTKSGGSFATISPHLAYQVFLGVTRLGGTVSMAFASERKAYTLSYQMEPKPWNGWRDGDNLYLPVMSTSQERYTGMVHNLEVESEHSFCLPIATHNCQEGWGLSITQAQAVGRPVIGLSEGAASEQILFGEVTSPGRVDYTARLTKAAPDPIAIAAAIDRIVEKGVFFSPETARLTAEKYNWDRIAEQWIAVIDRVHAERESLSLYIPEPDDRLKAPAAAVREVTP